MFSFHKPKIYRSISGCCICKAKSSSSRFTDSKKYEAEFERCFRIQEKRTGEICNACVLLVKRWKKLSPENRCIKNWNHVVDARAGPGTKASLSKQQQSQRSQNAQSSSGSSISRENRSNNNGRHIKSSSRVGYLSSSTFEADHHNNDQDDVDEDDDDDDNDPKRDLGKGLEMRKKPSANKQLLTASNNNTSKYNDIILNRYKREASEDLDAYSTMVMTNTSRMNLDDDEDDLDMSSVSRGSKHRRKPLFSCRYRSGGGDAPNLEENNTAAQQLRFSSRMTRKTTTPYSSNWSTASSNSDPTSQQIRPDESNYASAMSAKINRSKRKSPDNFKITSLLDMTLWKKEKICCGIIFRGLHDEVAIFPKLLRPCSCRLKEMMSSPSRTTNKDTTASPAGGSSISSSSLSDSISTSSNDEVSSNTSASMDTSNANRDDLYMLHQQIIVQQ